LKPKSPIAVLGSGQYLYAKLKKVQVGETIALRPFIPCLEDKIQATCVHAAPKTWEFLLAFCDIYLGTLAITENLGSLTASVTEAA
jgi:hypothetical protein